MRLGRPDPGSDVDGPAVPLQAEYEVVTVQPERGLEPLTCSLRVNCSTTELRWLSRKNLKDLYDPQSLWLNSIQ